MIVVFVVDTSPTMAKPSSKDGIGLSRCDVAKMSVENLARSLDKRIVDHNRSVLLASARGTRRQEVGRLEQFDEFMLLSSSLQPDVPQQASPSMEAISAAAEAQSSCGAGGRLLVGSIEDGGGSIGTMDGGIMVPHPPDRSAFEHELKRLREASVPADSKSFPEWAGGIAGLTAALSHGLGLLSRYRLTRGRMVENFGMGRLPWMEHQMAKLSKGAGQSADDAVAKFDSPLQPACLVLLTDGECLHLPPEKGGGEFELRRTNMPLKELYKEPFRWDQRVFIIHIADASAPPLHRDLRMLCEVTGGSYMRSGQSVPSMSKLLSRMAPPKPRLHSVPDPLRLPSMPTQTPPDDGLDGQTDDPTEVFINGGPVCPFQCLESGGGQLHRAMLLFAGGCEKQRWILGSNQEASFVPSPIWCIPEAYFPAKKLDRLPPRQSQPLLHYSRQWQAVGSDLLDPYFIMKALHHLDHLLATNRKLLVDAGDNPPPIAARMLQRDVYLLDWLGGHGADVSKGKPNDQSNGTGAPRTVAGREHLPVFVRGAGRKGFSGEGDILNVGILHVPHNWVRLKDLASSNEQQTGVPTATERLPTLTLLPPDAHILIPLLIKVAEAEHRIIKKSESKEVGPTSGAAAGLKKKITSSTVARAVHLDDAWKSNMRGYLFRLPPHYQPAIRRVLRPLLPPSVLSLLNVDASESLPLACFSPTCLQYIINGEKNAREWNDRLRGMEQYLRMRTQSQDMQQLSGQLQTASRLGPMNFGYGQYDPRMSEHQYLNSLRNLPPPWKSGEKEKKCNDETDRPKSVSLLPASCLLSYYESRRRWIFGGTGLTTRGLHVPGVKNDGTNAHEYNLNQDEEDEPLIVFAGCGAHTTNETSISKMGDFKSRLSVATPQFVDYFGNSGSALTTASDGSPKYSVDDDVLPLSFFDSATGEFMDSPQARSRAALGVNFGNPFQDKRGGSIVPEKYLSQRPPLQAGEHGPRTPPGSPPHDAYDSHSPIEGEGEAAFTGKRPSSPSPPRGPRKLIESSLKRGAPEPPLKSEEKRRKMATLNDGKSRQDPASATSSSQPPPRSRPPPPKSHPHSKPGSTQKPPPPKPAAKPAPPQPSSETSAHPQKQTSDDPSPKVSASAHAQEQQPQPPDLTNKAVKPKIQLPEGWVCEWSRSQKRWYFFDTANNRSVWDPQQINAPH